MDELWLIAGAIIVIAFLAIVVKAMLKTASVKTDSRISGVASQNPPDRRETPEPAPQPGPPPVPSKADPLAEPYVSHYWRPPGTSTEIRGRVVPDGMLYVGRHLSSVKTHGAIEPSLIDPSLRVDDEFPNDSGVGMPYWPSYSEISPSSRSAYLGWLESGRKNPSAYIGYVFLFLYGLERRVLFDFSRDPAAPAEIHTIIAELERLLAIYTESRSFQRYASSLLEVARLRTGADLEANQVRIAASQGIELPLILRVAAGLFTLAGTPLPVEWALAWVYCDQTMPTRTPGKRCRSEFDALFGKRYAARYGQGLVIKGCKRQVSTSYRAASASLPREIPATYAVPDVTMLVEPRRSLAALVAECCVALAPLSRLRGKDESRVGALASISALPTELMESHAPPELIALREKLSIVLGDREVALASAGEVFDTWLPAADAQLTKAASVELLRAVERAGFGVEPDTRFGGPPIGTADRIAVFRASEGDPSTPSAEYSVASLFLHLGACVAHSDRVLGGEEQQRLREHLSSALHLGEAERGRLRAHLAWLGATPPDTTRLKKRIEALDATQRGDLGRFLVGVALADGRVEPAEVKSLTKMFRLLGLDPAGVHEVIHAAQASLAGGELARIPASGTAAADYTIPTAPGRETASAEARATGPRPLDMVAVEAKIRESTKVAAMLSEILAPGDDLFVPAVEAVTLPSSDCVRSLDGRQTKLLRALEGRPSWPREEFERLCAEIGLLPDGTLETLNDLAFETCGAPLVEGDDPIDLDMGVYTEIVK